MDLFSSHLSNTNSNTSNSGTVTPSATNNISSRPTINNVLVASSSGASDKLKKLQIISKKENNNSHHSNTGNNSSSSYRSTSSLFASKEANNNKLNNETNNSSKQEYEEILIAIRKSEKGFGFELKNGILIVKVLPNSPASNSGIKVGDIILKVNGTCVRSKDANEITHMIHESNSFVSLTLQRKIINVSVESTSLPDTISSSSSSSTSSSSSSSSVPLLTIEDKSTHLKNVTNQLNNSNSIDQSDLDIMNAYETQLIHELSGSCREDTENTNTLNTNNKISNLFVDEHTSTDQTDEKPASSSSAKLHRKQFSIPDDWIQEEDESISPSVSTSVNLKKTLSNSNSKPYQTKSLSSIAIKPSLAHSTSDNELDQSSTNSSSANHLANKQRFFSQHQRNTFNNETDIFFPYKDDLAMPNDTSLNDSNPTETNWDLSAFTSYTQLMAKPVNVALFLNYLLSSSDSPKNLYFCMFSEEFINSNEKKETLHRWSYELYSTYLMTTAPLKLKLTESIHTKFDEYFNNLTSNETVIRKLFDDAKLEAMEIVNVQLNKFREVNQMGLANLFQGGSELTRLSQLYKNDSDQLRQALAGLFINYINEINRSIDLNRIASDWNDSRIQEAQYSALISSFVTYIKRYGLPIKQLAKYDLDKIPTFVNKKFKPKKQPASIIRSHSFVEYLSTSTKTICLKCRQSFWGIGNQALICQKAKCEAKFHRNCLSQGLNFDCQGLQKTIRTDYKEKLDSFQKILFGSSKKKEDEPTSSNFFIQSFSGSAESHLNQKKEHERQASIISSNFSTSSSSQASGSYLADMENHNLPVEVAIKKFENLFKQPTTTAVGTNVAPKIRLNSEYNTLSSNDESHPATSGKEQACKRVGSLKTDVKKVKTNVARSKSDPHPDDIKNAISTDINKPVASPTSPPAPVAPPPKPNNKRYSVDMSSFDHNESLFSPKASSTIPKITHSMSKTSTSLLSTNSRNSWMNDSDMEVDEELPNLSLNIERDKFEKLSKKDVKVQEVINELIHTEQKHVRNLKIMKNHFYIPIKLEILLTDDERNLLFPNLDEILDLHSTFNNKLKKLRKENPIVPVNQLVDVIQDQFQGETGYRFQTACATFCQNQSEAMKFLQVKSKLATDKFTSFLAKSENDVICRKLHLKDFLPTEVQRLVKYRLLFQELTKNTADEENKKRLVDCIDASSKISLHVNKAVTECENKKRVIEIQNKLDTKEFDQYCVRSPVLSPYKNLQLTSRKLVYEGELEWKLSNLKLMALLFEDILVFLETVRHESSNDEKRRYLLRPLIYIIGKSKQMFTPVIPLTCINSFRSMHDKRSFHLVAIIEDGAKLTKHSTISSSSSSSSSKPIQAQMLFILIAKSGDERNKWTTHLQELTGKMMQTVGNDLQTSNVQDLTNKPTSLTNTISATNLLSNYTPNSIKNSNSVSSSALLSNKSIELSNETKPANDSCLSAQLEKNTADILSLLKSRHELLIQIRSDSAKNSELSLFDNNESTNSKVLISSSIGLLNTMTANLLGSSESMSNSQHANSIQIIVKLEEYLNKLNRNLNESSAKLPDLKSTMSTSITKKQPSIGSSLSRVSRDFSNNLTDSVADAVSTTTTSELTADLSEDEQINYYDEYDYNSSNDNIYDAEKLENGTSTVNQPSVLRRFSDSSNKTLCVLTPSVGKVHVQKSMNVDADDEEEDLLYRKKIDVNNDKFSRKNSIVNSQNEYLDGVSAKNKLTCSQSSSDLNETTKKQTALKYSDTFDGGSEVRKSFRSSNDIFKSMAKEPKPLNTLINSPSKTSNLVAAISSFQSESPKIVKANQIPPAEDLNDSSDDEVKDYLTFKDNFDEISHV